MPYIPHTPDDVSGMLAAIGAKSLDELFDEVPPALRIDGLPGIPAALSEMETAQLMHERAGRDAGGICFMGAGAYDHHIPAAVWELVTRGEFYSAYTPYQAEASQGTLQVLYEYQTMMASLTGMDVSNASLYDGASALAEAVLMAVRQNRKSKSKRVLMPGTVHPVYRSVTRAIVANQGIELVEIPYGPGGGCVEPDELSSLAGGDFAALVIPQPNYFGALEEVDELTDWAHLNGMLVIGLVNPLALGMLTPPGAWGATGADIACGDGQPLGSPLSSGGPYFGFLCSRQAFVRQMPGRLVGRTVDLEGKEGFTLTLQAREQHIRRSKATSNICTNQGLLVTAATIHMAILGPDGLAGAAAACHANTRRLVALLSALPGVERAFNGPFYHEAVLRLDRPVEGVLEALAQQGVLGGCPLGPHYPGLGDCLLVCATEKRTGAEIERYADRLGQILEAGG